MKDPKLLCKYLYDLGKQFNLTRVKVLAEHTDDEILITTQFALTNAVGKILTIGMDQLDIEIPLEYKLIKYEIEHSK